MNQQIVIDNRPGGALMIGMELVRACAARRLHDTAWSIGALAIGPNMVRGLTFSVLKDLQPLAQTTTGSMLLAASPATPFKSVREVIDYAKQYPDKLSNASSGNGTPGHVGFELFKIHDRHAHRAHSLQRRRRRHDRPDRRPGAIDDGEFEFDDAAR